MLNRIITLSLVILWPALVFAETAAVKVKVVPAIYSDLYDEYEAVGECLSLTSRDLTAVSGGTITEISKSQGSNVKIGDVIIKINGPLSEAQYKSADLSFQREVELFKKGIISKEALEKSRINFEKALSDYNNMIILAPFDGRIGVMKQRVGDIVKPGDELCSITNGSSTEILVHLPEKLLSVVTRDTKVEIYDKAGASFPGSITSSSPHLSKASGNFLVKIISDDAAQLSHGSFVKIKLFLRPHKAIVVPEQVIMKNDKGSFVFKIDDANKAKRVYVTLGSRLNNQIEIISGIEPGDKVVTEGLTKLSDDSIVAIVE
ncbi:MAG: efflux RND transporter periplasmic adaptor subunit [Pseudomonadota bacterium]